jgi:hypothetical protein
VTPFIKFSQLKEKYFDPLIKEFVLNEIIWKSEYRKEKVIRFPGHARLSF